MASADIIVFPFHDNSHIFPAIELCNQLASCNYNITILLPSGSAHSPSSPLIRTLHYPPQPGHFPAAPNSLFQDLLHRDAATPPPVCAIVDVMMTQILEVCREAGVPSVIFFTSSACSAAIDHATYKLEATSGDCPRLVLPEELALMVSDANKPRGPPPPPPPPFGLGGFKPPPPPPPFGPSSHGSAPPPFGLGGFKLPPPPRGLQVGSSVALLFNTCEEIEVPFLEYIAKEAGRPAWGVGPLLPAKFWSSSTGSVIHDTEVRGSSSESTTSERDVLEWLDSKPDASVVYISFGSLVAPSDTELAELAAGLEESGRFFIWAFQTYAMRHDLTGHPTLPSSTGNRYFPVELARVAEDEGRGLVIRGWAPQLLILSHRSTGGFLTHCGWNSTVEAMACGVPLLAWPIRGDQVHNASLVVRLLKVGHAVRAAVNNNGGVTKEEVIEGIERLMLDRETRDRATSIRFIFAAGFPKSSLASLGDFLKFIGRNSQ